MMMFLRVSRWRSLSAFALRARGFVPQSLLLFAKLRQTICGRFAIRLHEEPSSSRIVLRQIPDIYPEIHATLGIFCGSDILHSDASGFLLAFDPRAWRGSLCSFANSCHLPSVKTKKK